MHRLSGLILITYIMSHSRVQDTEKLPYYVFLRVIYHWEISREDNDEKISLNRYQ